MSIAHLGLAAETRSQAEGWQGERTPPHDLLAEQSTIGGMLLSKDAVADVVETVRGADFYLPKHEVVFDAILSLYSHGEPTDIIAVTDELTKTGQLQRAGGAEYLHTLTGLVPTAANAGYYASIVAEKAVLRRLVEAGTRIVQMGYASEGEVTDLVNNAQAEIYGVTSGVEAEDYVPLIEAINVASEEIELASVVQSSVRTVPLRMLWRNTFDSAESRRIAISLRPISSEKKIVGKLCVIAAVRAKSSARVDLPIAGRAAMMIICPGWSPFVSWSSPEKPVGMPVI